MLKMYVLECKNQNKRKCETKSKITGRENEWGVAKCNFDV